MRVCLCDERMASGSGRLTALLCGCADGLQAVCSLTRPSAPLTAKGGGAGETGEVGGEEMRQEESGKLGRNVEKLMGEKNLVEEKGGIRNDRKREKRNGGDLFK